MKLSVIDPQILFENSDGPDNPQHMKADLLDYLEANNTPSDDNFHKWAEERGYDIHVVEEMAYQCASKMAMFLNNGRANEKGVTDADVDPNELKMGIKVEYEHTTDPATSKRIALDHLAELPDYYTRLKIMEGK